MTCLKAAGAVAWAFEAWGTVVSSIWLVWAFAGGCGSTGEYGGWEDPAAFGASSTLCWGGGRTLVKSFRVPGTT